MQVTWHAISVRDELRMRTMSWCILPAAAECTRLLRWVGVVARSDIVLISSWFDEVPSIDIIFLHA